MNSRAPRKLLPCFGLLGGHSALSLMGEEGLFPARFYGDISNHRKMNATTEYNTQSPVSTCRFNINSE